MYKILFFNFNPRSFKYIQSGFKKSGCETLEYVNEYENMDYILLENKLNGLLNLFKPDVVFSYGWWSNLENIDSFYHTLNKKGVLHIYWATDDPPCFDYMSLPIGKKTDILFTTAAECIDNYKKNGVNAYLLPFACCSSHHKKVPVCDSLKHDIVLLGHNYNVTWDPAYFAYRLNGIENLIKPIAQGNYDFMAWGLWWRSGDRIYKLPMKNYGLILPYEKVPQVYSSCKIALGLQTVGNSTSMISSRTFDALGCGAFHLSQYSPGLERYFKKGIHMEWSKSSDETIEIIEFYLNRDNLRNRIALKGQAEVYKNHTFKDRAAFVIKVLKSCF